jgi:release factor glutamine methyltransferase
MTEPQPLSTSLLGDSVTVGEAVGAAARRLAAAGIAESRREARLLVALALGVEPGVVLGYPERPLDAAVQARLVALTARRAAREPYARLAGRRQFWSLDLAISPDTLDPRPDSETLVEAALALLSELPNAVGVGIDILPGAAIAARRNAAALGLADRALFVVGHWGETISGRADVIVANPPYIPSAEIEALAPEVACYEPRSALDGGTDGLTAYRELAPITRRLLSADGIALFEVGAGQHKAVTRLLGDSGLALQSVKCDLSGVARCIVVTPAQF